MHLCLLNENKANICDLLADGYNKQAPTGSHKLTCNYNFWTGEYVLEINDQIKLIVHEYETTLKASSQISYWRLQNYFSSGANRELITSAEDLNDDATLKQGLMDYLFTGDYLKMPLHFFYSRESQQNGRFVYTNYMNATVRLPSDVINYFMIFYSNIWYK